MPIPPVPPPPELPKGIQEPPAIVEEVAPETSAGIFAYRNEIIKTAAKQAFAEMQHGKACIDDIIAATVRAVERTWLPSSDPLQGMFENISLRPGHLPIRRAQASSAAADTPLSSFASPTKQKWQLLVHAILDLADEWAQQHRELAEATSLRNLLYDAFQVDRTRPRARPRKGRGPRKPMP